MPCTKLYQWVHQSSIYICMLGCAALRTQRHSKVQDTALYCMCRPGTGTLQYAVLYCTTLYSTEHCLQYRGCLVQSVVNLETVGWVQPHSTLLAAVESPVEHQVKYIRSYHRSIRLHHITIHHSTA